jgi:HAD superfamily hydrolase (TIGR01549 family)
MSGTEAVILDLYGTLMHVTEKKHALKRFCSDIGIETHDDRKQAKRIAITENFQDLAGLCYRIAPGVHEDLTRYEHDLDSELKSVELYPETLKVLHLLKDRGFKVGLISNVISQYKRPFFRLTLNGFFDEIIFSCDVGSAKPDAKIYELMMQRLDMFPDEMIMIGDSRGSDVLGPQSVGMRSLHLDRKGETPGSICSLESLFDYL